MADNLFRPLLADDANLELLKFPYLVSPKLDGFRATIQGGKLVTRNGKLIKNPNVQEKFSHFANLDGELIAGDPRDPLAFNSTSKVVTSHTADPYDVNFYVFDLVSNKLYAERLGDAKVAIEGMKGMVWVPHILVMDLPSLLRLEEETLNEGYEGLMLRDPKGVYKNGRSTVRENILLKLKRFAQSEAKITGFVEQMHNANEAKIDTLGYTERSSHQAQLVPMGVLGALTVVDVKSGVEFNVGTGFTAEDRDIIWKNREQLQGHTITYRYLPVGMKDKPRHPSFLGFRPEGT